MYFEKESLQNNIGDDLDKRNRNFEKIESDITMMATNKITNGDFSNGTTGWGVMNSTLSTTNNTMSITGVGGDGDTNSRMSQSISIAPVIGKKIYVAFDAIVTNSLSNAIRVILFGTSNGVASTYAVSFPVQNANYHTSNILTVNDTFSGTGLQLQISHQYSDSATVAGKVMNVKNVFLIDLTATFGAGKEPTLAEMDRLMARYPNSWFDGTKPIQTIETLYQEKANKVQEAWITPTLLNGWTSDSGNPIQYRKDEFGRVWVRGRCFGTTPGSIAFAFPSGYRPTIFHDPICSKFNTNTASIGFGRVSVHPSGDLYIHSSTISSERFDLSGVSFSTN